MLKILTASKSQCHELSATSPVWYNSSPLSISSPPLNFTFADALCICLRPLKGYNPSNHLPLKRHKAFQNAQSGNPHPAVLNASCPTQQTSVWRQELEFNSWKECQNTVYWTPIFISRPQDKSYQGMNWQRDKKFNVEIMQVNLSSTWEQKKSLNEPRFNLSYTKILAIIISIQLIYFKLKPNF